MPDLTPPRLIPKKALTRARTLRRESTEAEKRLWALLQNRQLDGWKFRRQLAIDSYIVDFCCPAARLIVELDGGQHFERRKRYDDARTRDLQARGFKVIRFPNYEVLSATDAVAEQIARTLRDAGRTSIIPSTLT
jgi:very-short-patch-repair endonuclease